MRALSLVLCLTALLCAQDSEDAPTGPLDFTVLDAEGNEVDLRDYEGKVLLIVNVASRCGLTRQYTALQELQETYGERGFTVLAFPANDFMGQEPGSNEEIQNFCRTSYGVTFPVFAKIAVKGRDQHPLYTWLTEESPEGMRGKIRWNFDKFLVGSDGVPLARYSPRTAPDDRELTRAIEGALPE